MSNDTYNILIIVDIQNCFMNNSTSDNNKIINSTFDNNETINNLEDNIEHIKEIETLIDKHDHIVFSRNVRESTNNDNTNIKIDELITLNKQNQNVTSFLNKIKSNSGDSISFNNQDISYLFAGTKYANVYNELTGENSQQYTSGLADNVNKNGTYDFTNIVKFNESADTTKATIILKDNIYQINAKKTIKRSIINTPNDTIKTFAQINKGELNKYGSHSAFNYHSLLNSDISLANPLNYSTGLAEHINLVIGDENFSNIKITVCGFTGNVCVANTVHYGSLMKSKYPSTPFAKSNFTFSNEGTRWLTSENFDRAPTFADVQSKDKHIRYLRANSKQIYAHVSSYHDVGNISYDLKFRLHPDDPVKDSLIKSVGDGQSITSSDHNSQMSEQIEHIHSVQPNSIQPTRSAKSTISNQIDPINPIDPIHKEDKAIGIDVNRERVDGATRVNAARVDATRTQAIEEHDNGEQVTKIDATVKQSNGEHVNRVDTTGKHMNGEHMNGEHMNGEDVNGEDVTGEHTDDATRVYTTGNQPNEEHIDNTTRVDTTGNQPNEEHTDNTTRVDTTGNQSNGKHVNREDVNREDVNREDVTGNQPNEKHANGKNVTGNQPTINQPNGKDVTGNQPNEKQMNGEHMDVNASPIAQKTKPNVTVPNVTVPNVTVPNVTVSVTSSDYETYRITALPSEDDEQSDNHAIKPPSNKLSSEHETYRITALPSEDVEQADTREIIQPSNKSPSNKSPSNKSHSNKSPSNKSPSNKSPSNHEKQHLGSDSLVVSNLENIKKSSEEYYTISAQFENLSGYMDKINAMKDSSSNKDSNEILNNTPSNPPKKPRRSSLESPRNVDPRVLKSVNPSNSDESSDKPDNQSGGSEYSENNDVHSDYSHDSHDSHDSQSNYFISDYSEVHRSEKGVRGVLNKIDRFSAKIFGPRNKSNNKPDSQLNHQSDNQLDNQLDNQFDDQSVEQHDIQNGGHVLHIDNSKNVDKYSLSDIKSNKEISNKQINKQINKQKMNEQTNKYKMNEEINKQKMTKRETFYKSKYDKYQLKYNNLLEQHNQN
jgi:hypothetical protein